MYVNIPHTKWLLSYKLLSFLIWGGVQTTTGKPRPRNCQLLSPKMLHELAHQLLGLLFNYSRHCTYSQAIPRILNTWNSESRSSTIQFPLFYLALKTNSLQPKMPLCIYMYITFGSPQRDSVHFWGKYLYIKTCQHKFCLEIAGS